MYTKREWYFRLCGRWVARLAAVAAVGVLAWLFVHDWLLALISMGVPAELVLESWGSSPVSYRSYLRQALPEDEAVPAQ